MSQPLDLNARLANLAKTFELKAEYNRQASREALAFLDRPEGRFYESAYRMESDKALAQAALWDARASYARKGYMLFAEEDHADIGFTQEFGRDITECQVQGRCVYKDSMQYQRMQQDAANAPSV